jgi:fumarate hydratase subunit beta
MESVAYEDLGTEAIYRLEFLDLPLVVANDMFGGDLYEQGVAAYRDMELLK